MLWPKQQDNGHELQWDIPVPPGEQPAVDEFAPLSPEDEEIVQKVHHRLIQDMDLSAVEKLGPERGRQAVEQGVRTLAGEIAPQLYGERREMVIRRVIDDAIGLGPLEPLVSDKSISEVMVNSPDEIYFERDGIIYLSALRFRNADHIMLVIDRIIAPLGRRVDESSPFVDARLPDGSRVNVIIPPLVPRSPVITIRKFRPDKYSIDDLVSNGTMTPQVRDFLRACVQLRLNIVISGGTGSGKTTILNALSAFIPERERIVTIEDPIELKLQQRHVISAEARPPNIEGKNEVTQRDLLRNALRMRPDRIIIGEVRGPEAFDMMQAMNTGHEGSLTTVHANSPRDALSRVENMVLMAGFDLPARAIREQMAAAFHLIIQLSRFADGSRRLLNISEVVGMEEATVTMQEIFTFETTSIAEDGRIIGELTSTGMVPTFSDRFAKAGVPLDSILPNVGRWS
ncbi:MAG TPA: CpaF family protein [Dehalococcoidia bacterium]|nr:CpaF family protein [Dehalococcoidia bacterium]